MKFRIAGEQIQEMAAEEILDHVSAAAYKRIKKTDPNPTFRAYCIAHEGESTGKVIGMGRVVKNWVRSAIENINGKLTLGTQFFHMHGQETNEHGDRKAIAEVAGKVLADIAGKLSSIAIAYVFPEFRDLPLDIASIEADINMPESFSPNSRAVDVEVESITGIALGNSEICKPGFAGATLQASLQEFADNAGHEKSHEEKKPMTKDEIRTAIRDAKFKPSDLFGSEEISDDPIVQGVIRDKRRNEDGFERRMSEKLEAEKATQQKVIDDLTAKLNASNMGLLKTKAADSLKTAIEKRKLDEKQAAFVAKNATKFTPKSEDTLAGDLDHFIDAQIEDFKGFADIIGYKPAAAGGTAGIGAGKAGDNSVEDLLTPDELKDKK
jgi:uncharacterized coiled-coil protein SlyX